MRKKTNYMRKTPIKKYTITVIFTILFAVYILTHIFLFVATNRLADFLLSFNADLQQFIPNSLWVKTSVLNAIFLFSMLLIALFLRKPVQLIHWFFAFELPAIVVFLIAMPFIHILHSGTVFLIIIASVGAVAFFFHSYIKQINSRLLSLIHLITSSVAFFFGVYLFILMFAFALQMFAAKSAIFNLLKTYFYFDSKQITLYYTIFAMLIMFGALHNGVFFIYLYLKSLQKSVWQFNKFLSLSVSVLVVLSTAVLFLVFNRNNELQLAEKQHVTKRQLSNAYLSQLKYINLQFWSQHTAIPQLQPNNFIKTIATPFVYAGDSLMADCRKIKKRYETLFDTPIENDENLTPFLPLLVPKTISYATTQTNAFSPYQKIKAKALKIETEQTNNQQKITLAFLLTNQNKAPLEAKTYISLPADATETGIWNKTGNKKYYNKGEVLNINNTATYYTNEVAILQQSVIRQCGQTQYEICTFPLLPNDTLFFDNQNQTQLVVRYKTMQTGRAALPVFLQCGNIEIDETTAISINSAQKTWKTLKTEYQTIDLKNLSHFKQILVIADNSYSMQKHKKKLTGAINQLKKLNNSNCLITKAGKTTLLHIQKCDGNSFEYKGAQSPSVQLHNALIRIKNDKKISISNIDAVLMLTDNDTYFPNNNAREIPHSKIPLFVAYLSAPPCFTEKNVFNAVQSSGGGFIFAQTVR